MPNIAIIKERRARAAWKKVQKLANAYLLVVEKKKELRTAVISAVLEAGRADAACSNRFAP